MERLTRDRIIDVLPELPPDATLHDAIERPLCLGTIERGLAELDADRSIPHDEASGARPRPPSTPDLGEIRRQRQPF